MSRNHYTRMSGKRKNSVIAQYDTNAAAEDFTTVYDNQRVEGRLLHARRELIRKLLADVPAGRLLDAGCGPGVLVHSLQRSPEHDFAITAMDQSPAMIRYCLDNAPDRPKLSGLVGDIQALPFADKSFEITLVAGVLEYTDVNVSVPELCRVTQAGGLVIVSMLNPITPYWAFQWFVFLPTRRAAGFIARSLGLRSKRWHPMPHSGIRALSPRALRSLMHRVGLTQDEILYFNPTILISPLDRIPGLTLKAERIADLISSMGLTRWLSTGYLVVARRSS